jgi:hypothetical protein
LNVGGTGPLAGPSTRGFVVSDEMSALTTSGRLLLVHRVVLRTAILALLATFPCCAPIAGNLLDGGCSTAHEAVEALAVSWRSAAYRNARFFARANVVRFDAMRLCKALLFMVTCILSAAAQTNPRARDLGVPLEGTPGPLNAIVDVAGVEVGHRTIVSGDNVRTGVTAVWPRGKQSSDPVFGGFYSQNGNGDMTGTHWLEESGFLDGPILITNTHSVGVVRDSFLGWLVKNNRRPGTNVFPGGFYTYPIVAETYDGYLNDINGFHVKPEDVAAALDSASAGPVAEGNVGGGTGMICYGFKGGIGTSSRQVPVRQSSYTVVRSCNATAEAATNCASADSLLARRSAQTCRWRA